MSGLLHVPPGLGWAGRTPVERVGLYTVGSLYLLLWFVLGVSALGSLPHLPEPGGVLAVAAGTLVLGAAATASLTRAVRLHPRRGPLPWLTLCVLVVTCLAGEGVLLLAPAEARLGLSVVVVVALAWGAGGLRDRRVTWGIAVASPACVVLATGVPLLGLYGLGMGLFLVFTVQSSLWLHGVVTELDRARGTQAALAVAEERLRFSRDVHDVLGRRLSTIAVQAELAAALTGRGDPRAVDRILEVREAAHVALGEARELARGYRPLDLQQEVEGAVALLRSAGIGATADVTGLPEAWHEPVARVIREAVTNILRHSRATHVRIGYADGEVVVLDDGVHGAPVTATDGSGLEALRRDLVPLGAELSAGPEDGGGFGVRLRLAGTTAPVAETAAVTAAATGESL